MLSVTKYVLFKRKLSCYHRCNVINQFTYKPQVTILPFNVINRLMLSCLTLRFDEFLKLNVLNQVLEIFREKPQNEVRSMSESLF